MFGADFLMSSLFSQKALVLFQQIADVSVLHNGFQRCAIAWRSGAICSHFGGCQEDSAAATTATTAFNSGLEREFQSPTSRWNGKSHSFRTASRTESSFCLGKQARSLHEPGASRQYEFGSVGLFTRAFPGFCAQSRRTQETCCSSQLPGKRIRFSLRFCCIAFLMWYRLTLSFAYSAFCTAGAIFSGNGSFQKSHRTLPPGFSRCYEYSDQFRH